MYRRLTRFAGLCLFVALATTTVLAHLKALKTEPSADATLSSPPKQVQVWFSEAPDAKLSRIDLVGPAGVVKLAGVKAGAEMSVVAAVDGTLADGKYTARWQSAGDDGHLLKGEFTFTVHRTH